MSDDKERFEDLPPNSRVEVIYEREVNVTPIEVAQSWGSSVVPQISEAMVNAMPGWYAIIDAEGDLVCLVPPGGTVGTDNDAVQRASVVAAMLNQQAPSWPPDARDLQLVTVEAQKRGHADLHRGMWYVAAVYSVAGARACRSSAPLTGRSFFSVTLMCTLEDLKDAALMAWLHHDVATRLEPGGKLTMRVV